MDDRNVRAVRGVVHDGVVDALKRAVIALDDVGEHRLAESYLRHLHDWDGSAARAIHARRERNGAHRRAHDQLVEEHKRHLAQKRALRATAGEQRERMLLDALGDAALTIRALTARLRDEHPALAFTPEVVRGCSNDLLSVGELHREKLLEGRRMVWHYRRNTELRGPIADLDSQFGDVA